MASSKPTLDRKTLDLMARTLHDAWLEAGFTVLGLSENDWSEMADAITQGVAAGILDGPQLEELALEALRAHREILVRKVVASAMTLELGAALAGLRPAHQGADEASAAR
jgi:hypothetical protein